MLSRPVSHHVSVKILLLLLLVSSLVATHAWADTAADIDRDVDAALAKLYDLSPAAKVLSKNAKAILMFPEIFKGGLIVGAQWGNGALRKGAQTVGYYRTTAVSYGLQAGAQTFGYALFFMTDEALDYLEKSNGWEIGVGPSIVLVDEGIAKSLTTTTAQDGVYAFIFAQQGLMAGLGLQGSKISKLDLEQPAQ